MNKLNFSNVSFHQGDVQFFGLTELPSDVKKVQKILIALVIFSVSIVAVGCSSKDNNNKTTSDKIKNEEGNESFIFKFFGFIAAPLLIIIFFFSLILMVFGGGASKNSAILGTYYCNDYDMSRAIESYTNIAYEYNPNYY